MQHALRCVSIYHDNSRRKFCIAIRNNPLVTQHLHRQRHRTAEEAQAAELANTLVYHQMQQVGAP
jgi:hypothetical protein